MASGGTQLGSAYGTISLNAQGVIQGVDQATKALGGVNSKVLGIATSMTASLSVAAGVVVGGLVAVAASGTKMAMDLEAQMSGIQSVMQASGAEVEALENKILELGVDPGLKVSTMEAAAAVEMLGRNGLKTQQILDGAARSTILLSNATGGDFALSADLATDVMALFNFQASQMETAVDGITSVVNNSKFGIQDYQLALAQAGGTAATIGVPFEELNTTIAAIAPLFADGGSAGAGFKTMLQRLAAPTAEMKEVMSALKLEFFEANGDLKGMNEIAVMLSGTLAGLSEEQKANALTTLFGARAINAAAGLAESGAVAYETAAEAAEALGVSIDTVSQFAEGGITKYEALMITMGETSAADAAATRMDNLAGAMEILRGIIDTIRIRIGKVFIPSIRQGVEKLSQFLASNADKIVGFFRVVQTIFAGISGAFRAFFSSFKASFTAGFGGITKQSEGWGRNITISLARGIAAAAVAVVRALNFIGQIITGWLKPGSPPKLLPDLDKWGTGAADAYMGGWTQADFSIFDTLASTIEGYLRDMAPEDSEGLVPRILGSRDVIAQIVDEVRQTGMVAEDAFSRVEAVTGTLPAKIKDYAMSLFEAEAASKRMAEAQENLDRIQGINLDTLADAKDMVGDFGGILGRTVNAYVGALEDLAAANAEVERSQQRVNDVTKEYDEALAPLNAELQAIQDQQQQIRDAERLAELQAVLADETASTVDKQKAQLEIDELRLRQAIKAKEAEKDAAVDAAEAELTAAEEAAAAAQASADAKQQAAEEAAQAQLDAAAAEEEAAKQRLEMLSASLEQQKKQNSLFEEQADLLRRLAEGIEGVATAVGESLSGGGDGGLGDFFESAGAGAGGIGEEIGQMFGEGFEEGAGEVDIGETFEQMMSGLTDDILKEFEPLTTEATKLGDTWGALSGTIGTALTNMRSSVDGGVNFIQAKINTFLAPLRQWWDENWKTITAAFMTAWTVIQDIFNAAVGVLEPAFRAFIDSTSQSLSGFGDLVPMVGELWEAVKPIITFALGAIGAAILAMVGIAVGAFQGLMNAAAPLLETFKNVAAGIITAFTGVANFITGFVNLVIGLFQGNRDAVIAAWEQMKTGLAEIVAGIGYAIVTGIQGMIETLIAMIGGLVTGVIEFFQNLYNELVGNSIIPDMVMAIIEWVISLRDQFLEWILDLYEGLLKLFAEIVLGVLVWMQDFQKTIVERMKMIRLEWTERWNEIRDFLIDIWLQIIEKVTTFMGNLVVLVGEKINDAKNAVAGKVAEWVTAGSNLVQGLVDGVKNAAGDLISSVTGVVNDAIAAARALLGIESPSKVFMGFGQNTIAGFVKGAEAMRSKLQKSMDMTFAPVVSSPVLEAAGALGGAGLRSSILGAAMGGSPTPPPPAPVQKSSVTYQILGPVTLHVAEDGVQGALSELAKMQLGNVPG